MIKRNKKLRIIFIISTILAFVLLALLLFIKSPVFKVTLSTQETHLEIGNKPKSSPSVYLEGPDWSVPLSYVDTSSVKHTKVGRYPVYIYHGFQKLTSYVNVTDTTSPIVKCNIKNKTVTPEEIVSVKTLDLDIQDYSDIEEIVFCKISSEKFYTGLPEDEMKKMEEIYRKGIPMEAEEFQFSYGGVYTLTVRISDSFHNSTEVELSLMVETPPVLESPTAFYVADTKEINFEEYISVWDLFSEDIDFEDVKIDSSSLKLSTPGTYPVTLSVTDDYGLTTTQTVNVHVSSQNALQELIRTHAIDLTSNAVLGAFNSYDNGYYNDATIESIQKHMLPAIVYVQNDSLGTFGSGFIMEISDEFVTIATNAHVVENDMAVDVFFHDTTSKSGAVVASDAVRDIAFIRIPVDGNNPKSSLSREEIKNFRTVHINKSSWDSLSNDSNLEIAYACINKDGEIWQSDSGYILEKKATRDWNEYKNVSESIISLDPVSGTSGSALFDCHGQLVGMMRGYTDYAKHRETVAVPLDVLLNYFEVIFKYKIEYQ